MITSRPARASAASEPSSVSPRGHEVDGRVHAPAVGEPAHLAGEVAVADVDERVGAALLRRRQLVVADVGGDHPAATELGHLHAVNPHPAPGAHDEDRVSGADARLLAAGVVGRADRVGGDGRVEIAHLRRDRRDVRGRQGHVLGVGPVARHPHVAAEGGAERLAPAPAEAAHPAGQIEVARHPLAHLHVGHLGADLDDLTGHLVPGDAREGRDPAGHGGHDDHGEPDPGGAHPEQDVVRPDRGDGNRLQPQRRPRLGEHHRLHRVSARHDQSPAKSEVEGTYPTTAHGDPRFSPSRITSAPSGHPSQSRPGRVIRWMPQPVDRGPFHPILW